MFLKSRKTLPVGTKPVVGQLAPEAVFTDINGRRLKLSQFKGKKIMLWFLATWCPSCSAGANYLSKENDKLSNLQIIALQTYGNAGFPGIKIGEFMKKYAPQVLEFDNWLWGEASEQATKTYNPQNLPDIYYLIDEKGIIRVVSSAPAGTLKTIIDFSNGKFNVR